MIERSRPALPLVLALFAWGCCCPLDFGDDSSSGTTHAMPGLGLELELPSHFTAQGPGHRFVSSDGQTTVEVTTAAPGAPAAQRSATEIATGSTLWTRSVTIGGMPGTETKLRAAPVRLDWVASLDGPHGVVWVHVHLVDDEPLTDDEFDRFWTTVKDGLRRTTQP